MFGRKMRVGNLPNSPHSDSSNNSVYTNDKEYKEKSKEYYDKRNHVKNSKIKVGDKVLQKCKRNALNPIIGHVINIVGNAITARFENGKIYTRDKSHYKIINNINDEHKCKDDPKKRENVIEKDHINFMYNSSAESSNTSDNEVPQNAEETSDASDATRPRRECKTNTKYYNEHFVND